MKVMTKTAKFLGKKETLFQVVDAQGEVMQVLCTREEAEAWIAEQQ